MARRSIILQTKLQPPRIKKHILHRPRLIHILRDSLDKKLILICADAGYGKTTLLTQFCDEIMIPYLFYDLDANDNDLTTFYGHLMKGIQHHAPNFGKRLTQIISETRNTEMVVGTFINEFIENIQKDFFIILDNFHQIQNNRRLMDYIDYLLRHIPEALHLIIATRSTPPLDIPYFSAKQDLLLLEKTHLLFDEAEIRALLKNVYGMHVPEEEVQRIAAYSQGWPTALQLILQKIYAIGVEKTKETINGYLDSGEEVFEYFASEIFEQLPKRIREFLIRTSILNVLEIAVCNYLLSSRTARRTLIYLETEHIFVMKAGAHYKYHPLFQEFLQRKLRDYYPSKEIKSLHKKMAKYFLQQKNYSMAIHHFLIADSYQRAVTLLRKYANQWSEAGEQATFIDLVERIPNTVLTDYPYLRLKKVWFLIHLTRYQQALKELKGIMHTFRKQKNRQGIAESYFAYAILYLVLIEPDKALRSAKRALKLIRKEDRYHQFELRVTFGSIYRQLGKCQLAEKYLKEAWTIAKKARNQYMQLCVLRSLGLLYWAVPDYTKAEQIYHEIIHNHEKFATSMEGAKIFTNAAIIAGEKNKLKNAYSYAEQAEKIALQYNDRRTLYYLKTVRGELGLYQGHYNEALKLFQEALEIKKEFEDRYLIFFTLTDMAYAYTMLGNYDSAKRMLDEVSPLVSPHDFPQTYNDFLIVKGKLAIALGNHTEALSILHEALKLSQKIRNQYQEMMVYFAMGECYLKQHRSSDALHNLKKSLSIAEKSDYQALLIKEGYADLSLLAFALAHNIHTDFLLLILNQIETPSARKLVHDISLQKGVYDIRCDFLGTMQITNRMGEIVTPHWRTKRSKLLFIFLVCNRENGCTKDKLIDTFWMDQGLRESLHSLQVEISFLRNQVKKWTSSDIEVKSIIVYKNNKYVLNSRLLIRTDVKEFEQNYEEANNHYQKDRALSLDNLERAQKLYKGDFCADIADEWCEHMRRKYLEMYLDIILKKAQHYFEHGEYEKSLALYKKASLIDAFNEQIHIAIMRCYAGLNNHVGVQKQYQRLEENLKKIGTLSPSEEALKLYRQHKNSTQ